MSVDDQLAELRAWTVRVESDVAAEVHTVRGDVAGVLTSTAGGGAPGDLGDLELLREWVADYLAPTFARHVGPGWRWCPRWAEHPEAVERLGALQAGHRAARAGGGLLAWLRYLDAQLAALADPAGTFAACTAREHRPAPPLPCAGGDRLGL